jgi:hypothetical protein
LFRHLLLQIGGANIDNPPPSSALAEERTPPLASPPCGGARFADARSPRGRSLSSPARDLPTLAAHAPVRLRCTPPKHFQEAGLTQFSDGLHMLHPVQTARYLRMHRFLTADEGLRGDTSLASKSGDAERACAPRLARWSTIAQVNRARRYGTKVARVGAFDGEDAWESARCLSPTGAKSPFA